MSGCGQQAATPPAAVPTAAASATEVPAQPVAAAATQQPAMPATQAPSYAAAPPQGQPVPPVVARNQPVYSTPVPQPVIVQPQAIPPVQMAQTTQLVPASRAVNTALHGELSGIEAIHEKPSGSGAGAVVGGVLGAVIGNRFGHGTGRAAMTGVGAIGGAFAGNTVERNMNEHIVGYRLSVRLDNGQTRSFQESQLDGLRIGDRVRIERNHVRRA
jgi:outer membrane lipoprotein SlyB